MGRIKRKICFTHYFGYLNMDMHGSQNKQESEEQTDPNLGKTDHISVYRVLGPAFWA
jgi:hypothetical protein